MNEIIKQLKLINKRLIYRNADEGKPVKLIFEVGPRLGCDRQGVQIRFATKSYLDYEEAYANVSKNYPGLEAVKHLYRLAEALDNTAQDYLESLSEEEKYLLVKSLQNISNV